MNAQTETLPLAVDESAESAPQGEMDHPLIQDLLLSPSRWRIWPAIAVVRWVLRSASKNVRRIVYRSKPSLQFATAEIEDIGVEESGVEITLAAPGIAAGGSPKNGEGMETFIT